MIGARFICRLTTLCGLALLLAGTALDAASIGVPSAPETHIFDPSHLLTERTTRDLRDRLLEEQARRRTEIYLALLSSTTEPPGAFAGRMSESWITVPRGAVIVLAADQREIGIAPSAELQQHLGSEALVRLFRESAGSSLGRGNFDTAAARGIDAVLRTIDDLPPEAAVRHRMSRRLLALVLLAATAAVAFTFWLSLRAWIFSNLFGRQYHFAPVAPKLRFGGDQTGGQMAVIRFGSPPES